MAEQNQPTTLRHQSIIHLASCTSAIPTPKLPVTLKPALSVWMAMTFSS